MFERDTNVNRMSTIGRWKKTDRRTGLQVNLQNGSMGVKWFHDTLPWYLKKCHDRISTYHRLNGENSGRIYLSNSHHRSDRVRCYIPINTSCKDATDIDFKEFSSDCSLGKISIKYINENVLRIVDICGRSSNESLFYPTKISGSSIIFSFDIESHDFRLELAWKCSSEQEFTPNNCIADSDVRVRDHYLNMGEQFSRHPMSCLLTADTVAVYNGCLKNELIWDNDDSPWYLTKETPYIISNKKFPIFNDKFEVKCGSRYTPYEPKCINLSKRITRNNRGYIESYHPYGPTDSPCEFRVDLAGCMIEYRMTDFRISTTDSFIINGKLIPGGFLGWVNTKVNYLEVTFIAKSYNYGFDMEWRCSSSNESILDSAAIQQTFSIFSSFRIPDPAMKTFTERNPVLLSWPSGKPSAYSLEITFEPKVSNERYIKRNDRASSFGACALNIKNEIFLVGGNKNPFQISKLNGNLFQFLSTYLPMPVSYPLCAQPTEDSAIICGNANDDDRKSCFEFNGDTFGEISEVTAGFHRSAISTHLNDSIILISVDAIELLLNQTWSPLPLIEVSENMVAFGSAITMKTQILVFGGVFANSGSTDLVFRYQIRNNMHGKWEEMQKLLNKRSYHRSILAKKNVIVHVSTAPDSIEQWIYDENSDTFLIEAFDLNLFQEQLAETSRVSRGLESIESRPVIVPFSFQSNIWSQWSSWSKMVGEGTWTRERCKTESANNCQIQNNNMNESNSILIIGFDFRLVPEKGQIDIGPHVMHVQTPLATIKTEEIGYFRLPQGRPFSWDSGYYARVAILKDMVFMMGSRNELHLQDIFVIRNCGFELYHNNGKQIKFPETAKIRAPAINSFQGIDGEYILVCGSFYNEQECYQFNGSTPFKVADTLVSHKLGVLSKVDGKPFIIAGFRTFETEILEGSKWQKMPIFPFRDFGEVIRYIYHTSEVSIDNEVLVFGGSCGGACAHNKVFKFNRDKVWVRLQDMTGPRKAHGSIVFKGRIYLFFGRTDKEYEKTSIEEWIPNEKGGFDILTSEPMVNDYEYYPFAIPVPDDYIQLECPSPTE